METAGYPLAVVLAAVFVAAAVPKLRRPDQTAASFRALGLPAPTALARGVPTVELTVAATLLGWPRVGAAVALMLLGGFTVVLARAVAGPDDVPCACFGVASAEPVTARDLVRNAALMAGAVVALAATDPVAPDLPGAMFASVAVLVAMVVLGLVDLKLRLGVVLDNTLPGEVTDQTPGLGRA